MFDAKPGKPGRQKSRGACIVTDTGLENYSVRVLTDWIELGARPISITAAAEDQMSDKSQSIIFCLKTSPSLQQSNIVRLQWKGWQEPLSISV